MVSSKPINLLSINIFWIKTATGVKQAAYSFSSQSINTYAAAINPSDSTILYITGATVNGGGTLHKTPATCDWIVMRFTNRGSTMTHSKNIQDQGWTSGGCNAGTDIIVKSGAIWSTAVGQSQTSSGYNGFMIGKYSLNDLTLTEYLSYVPTS